MMVVVACPLFIRTLRLAAVFLLARGEVGAAGRALLHVFGRQARGSSPLRFAERLLKFFAQAHDATLDGEVGERAKTQDYEKPEESHAGVIARNATRAHVLRRL